jgi:hypothetical protein
MNACCMADGSGASHRLWLVFAILGGISLAVQMALPVDFSDRPETSFDTAPRGHAALFELLQRFHATPGRWLSGVSMPSVDDTIWWIAPDGICDPWLADSDREVERQHAENAFRHGVQPWIEAGGTAVVWLSHPPLEPESLDEFDPGPVETREVMFDRVAGPRAGGSAADPEDDPEAGPDSDPRSETGEEESLRQEWREDLEQTEREIRQGKASRCLGIAGFPLPVRRLAGLDAGEMPIDADRAATAFSVGRWVASRADFDYDRARTLPGSTLAFFERDAEALDGWQPLWVEADDFTAFALARSLAAGRLIVVADARVLSNDRLAHVDAAPFVFDWVEQWGRPWIDEHSHGIVPESGTLRYLARSPAWAACLGLLALGSLVIWRGHAWPTRCVDEVDPDAPTLAAFVESLASLYARTRDHGRVFERYRALSLERVRRAIGLAPGTAPEIVLASLRARAQSRPALRERGLRDLLTQAVRIENAAELERATARLDELVRVLREENGNRDAARRART